MNISISSVTNLTDDKDFIKWDSKFALGIPIIDEQHKHLVEPCAECMGNLKTITLHLVNGSFHKSCHFRRMGCNYCRCFYFS